MDQKLLLVKSITLLYKEGQLMDATASSAALVKTVVGTIKFPETGMDFDRSRESMQSLRATALWMAENPPGHSYDRAQLLQRIRVNAGDDEGVYYAIEQGFETLVDVDTLKLQCISMRHELRGYVESEQIRALMKKAYTKSHFQNDTINWRDFVREIYAELEPLTSGGGEQKLDGELESIDLADIDSLGSLIARSATQTSSEGSLSFGWQGLNRMTGDHNGGRRGEFLVVGALQHNFKSGFTLNMFKQAALYNKPWMMNPTKKPLLLHISTENSLELNILWLYGNLKENETGVECDLSYFKVDDPDLRKERVAEASRYVHERMTANGYHIKMCRWDPSKATYHTLFEYIQKLEAEGFEIHMAVVDYLNMFSKKGCDEGPAGWSTRDLFRRVRNFTEPRGIYFVTPHQLSTEAKGLIRQNVENFVQEIANKGYYDSCRTIDQEVDMEIYIHIVKVNGKSFLTVQRGKHRKAGKLTAERDMYTVLPFSPVGGILDDINGKDSSRRHVGGGEAGSDDETPWWVSQKAA